jgi:TctA family transporter
VGWRRGLSDKPALVYQRRGPVPLSLAPFTLVLVLGSRAEDAFRLSMIGSGGDMKVFWSNGLVGSITTLAILLLFWALIDKAFASLGSLMRPALASG